MDAIEKIPFDLLAQGSAEGFDFYYHAYHQAIFTNILKIVPDREMAKDILQEVFIRLWEHRERLLSPESVPGWLFVVSYNLALNFIKRKLKESSLLLQNQAVMEQLMDTQEVDEAFYQRQMAILQDAVNHLPHKKKQVFHMCRLEGRSAEDAAAALGISVNSVKDYLKQSSVMIRRFIQENYKPELAMLAVVFFGLRK